MRSTRGYDHARLGASSKKRVYLIERPRGKDPSTKQDDALGRRFRTGDIGFWRAFFRVIAEAANRVRTGASASGRRRRQLDAR